MSNNNNNNWEGEQLVSIADCDLSRAKFGDVDTKQIKDSKGKIKLNWTKSDICYTFEDGVEDLFLLEGPKVYCYKGFQPKWEMNIDDEDRTPLNISGYQCPFTIVSSEQLANPTQESMDFMGICDELHSTAYGWITGEDQIGKVPAGPRTFLKVGEEGLKEMYQQEKDILDKKNPGKMRRIGPSMTVKMIWEKKSKVFKTMVMGPGGIRVNPSKYIDQPGFMEPIFWIDNIYFGGHGTTPVGASLQIRLWACNYTPMTFGTKGPKKNLLKKHSASATEDIQENDQAQKSLIDLGNNTGQYTKTLASEVSNTYNPNAALGEGGGDTTAPQKPKATVKRRVVRRVVKKKQ